MIVDAHTHIFPPDVIERREMFIKRDSSFELLYGDPGSRMVTYEELLEEMDSAGVDKAIICGFPWKSLDMCRRQNSYTLEAVNEHPDRFIGLAVSNPVAGKASDAELDRCFDGGLKGVGEVSASAQGFRLDDELTMGRLVRAVEDAGFFLLLHANEDVGHGYRGKTTDGPEAVYRFLQKFTDVTTVLAHWGGGLLFYELMPEVAKVASSVYYDAAASPFLYRPEIYHVATQIVGPARILYGSDYPLLGMQRHIEEVRSAGLDPDTLEAILGRNALALVGHRFD